MKIFARILIISFVFTLSATLIVIAVNASGISSPHLAQPEFHPPDNIADGNLSFPSNEQQDGGSRWLFGVTKNVGVISILVVVIVLPKKIIKKKKRTATI